MSVPPILMYTPSGALLSPILVGLFENMLFFVVNFGVNSTAQSFSVDDTMATRTLISLK